MTKIKELKRVNERITQAPLESIQVLHRMAYGVAGKNCSIRKDLRKFEGFGIEDISSEEFAVQLEKLASFGEADIVMACSVFGVSYKGDKDAQIRRIATFLNDPVDDEIVIEEEDDDDDDGGDGGDDNGSGDGGTDDDDGDGDNDDDDGDGGDGNDDESDNGDGSSRGDDGSASVLSVADGSRKGSGKGSRKRTASPRRSNTKSRNTKTTEVDGRKTKKASVGKHRIDRVARSAFSLTFRDVEDSLVDFTGKDDYPVEKWVSDFEELAETAEWNDLQKLIFAKKKLTGLARKFVQGTEGIKTWRALKKLLLLEFERKIDSAQIHKLLTKRLKKNDESVEEYTLEMKEIGNRIKLEPSVIINYIIEGIKDESAAKVLLYGADNFRDFKEKIRAYEHANAQKTTGEKENAGKKTNKAEEPPKRPNHKRGTGDRKVGCYNCGKEGHNSRNCPEKDKGIKCFACNQHGHIAAKCPKAGAVPKGSTKPNESANLNVLERDRKNVVKVGIDSFTFYALLDTGSDISALREDIFRKHFTETVLMEDKMVLKGIGKNTVETMGSWTRNITINGEEVELKLHVIPKASTSFELIIGNDLLEQADIIMSNGDIQIKSRVVDNFMMRIESEEVKLDVQHITDKTKREIVQKLMDDYEPMAVKTTDIKMRLLLKDEKPIYERARKLAASEKAQVDQQVSEWLEEGIIRPSSSDYASPVVLVKKKDGSIRLCVDYRRLNKVIIRDRFPLPLVEDVLDTLEGAKFFSTIDLRNGFFHVSIEEDSVKYTSFVTHNGQYEFLKCPFGLCNSPSVFQRFIAHVLKPLTSKNIAIYYMDDIIIPSVDEEQGIQRLKMVLDLAREYGLQIKKKKCQLLMKRVQFLGFIVENGKVQPSMEKTMAIKKFPEPITLKMLQSFLGLTGYFRKFIPGYSTIAKPLSDLLRKNEVFEITDVHRSAIAQLKEMLSSGSVLQIFRQGSETELHTDASKVGYGACLMQRSEEDNKFHPVYYMSRKTSLLEEKYSSYELEVLAVVKAVRKFRVYLLGYRFKIVTDCSAFTQTMNKRDMPGRISRWALLLQDYEYELEHRAGKKMSHVDALSRCPIMMTIVQNAAEDNGLIQRIKLAQDSDEHVHALKTILKDRDTFKGYFVKKELLFKYKNGKELLVVPKDMEVEIVRRAHEVGHFAVSKIKEVVEREFYIEKLDGLAQACIRNCIKCILANHKEGKKEGFLHAIPKQQGPLHTFHADHLGPIPSTSKNYQHILAIIDDFSKFVWLYPVKSTTSRETIDCLKKLQKDFGNPARIVTDRGTAYTSKEFEEFCSEEGIQHLLITTGVPRGNGQVERVHRIVIPVLTKLSMDNPARWYQHVQRVQTAINSTYQRSINSTPFEVLVGVKMRSKEDIRVAELIQAEDVQAFNKRREDLRAESRKQIVKVQEENRRQYNLRRKKAHRFKVGTLVAIKRTQFGAGLKVQRKYLGPYEVVAVKPNERYDVVKIGSHEGPIRTSSSADYMKPWIGYHSESESDSE